MSKRFALFGKILLAGIVGFAIILLIGLLWQPFSSKTDTVLAQATALAQSRQKWQSKNVTNYRMNLMFTHSLPPIEYRLEVNKGKVVWSYKAPIPNPQDLWQYVDPTNQDTVEDLYKNIENHLTVEGSTKIASEYSFWKGVTPEAIREGVQVKYNQEYGFPENIIIKIDAPEASRHIELTQFEPIT